MKYEEIMMNNDNLESNLLTSSLLKRHLVYMWVPLQVNYAVEIL